MMLTTHPIVRLFAAGAVIAAMFLGLLAGSAPRTLARTLQGTELLVTQIRADLDQDRDVDFSDFTVFAALYEEE